MSTWTDGLGRIWNVAVDPSTVAAWGIATDRDVFALERLHPGMVLDVIEGDDPWALAGALWFAVRAQAEAAGIDGPDFARGLDARALARGGDVLREEWGAYELARRTAGFDPSAPAGEGGATPAPPWLRKG